MAENTNPGRIKEVRILGEDGAPVGDKVKISPDAADVMVHDASEYNANHTSLQDFLFRKFLVKDTSVGQMRAKDEEDPYFTVDPTQQSVWQGWHDYQDITKKRLVGLYDQDGKYVGDFLLGKETDLQAQYTLTNQQVDEEANIEQVIVAYGLENKVNDQGEILIDQKWVAILCAQDPYKQDESGNYIEAGIGFYTKNESGEYNVLTPYILTTIGSELNSYIPLNKGVYEQDAPYHYSLVQGDIYTDITGNKTYVPLGEEHYVLLFKIKEDIPYTPEDKAKELMLQFGEKSFWQALIDNQTELKNKLIGIYDQAGNCVGHFEPTRYNIDVIKEIYKDGFVIRDTEEGKLVYGGVNNDQDALDLMLDLEKKSVYQQLIELKDFWITLPFEEYDNTASGGSNIVNKYDISQLHFADIKEVNNE